MNHPDLDSMTPEQLLADELARVAPEPTPAKSKSEIASERMQQALFDSVAEPSRALAIRLGEFLLCHELKVAGGAPFYCLRESQFPTEIGESIGGYQHPLLDLSMRSTLERMREYRGRGPAICLNDISAFDEHKATDNFRVAFACLAIHEISHCVEYAPFDLTNTPPPEYVDNLETQLGGRYVYPRATGRPPWHNHGAGYLRVVIHAAYRVRRSGLLNLPFDLGDVFFSQSYGLSAMDDYAVALGTEPEQLARAPLSILNINCFDPPPAFTKLFADDCESWHARNAIKNQPASTTE